MLTGLETKKVIVGAADAAMRPQAPVNVFDRDGSAVIIGSAELIDVAMAGVYPSTAQARLTRPWFLI